MNFKKFKRLASVILSLSMVLSTNMPVLATEVTNEPAAYSDELMLLQEEDATTAETEEVTITLSKTSLSLAVGATDTLTATITPDSTTDQITWSSDDESIATVSEADGTVTVTAVAAGTTNIKATLPASEDGSRAEITATCAVTVTAAQTQETSITLNPTTLSLTANGATGTITATVENADAAVTWTSSDQSIATVAANDSDSKTATVTPVAAGTATITAAVGDKTATCTVTVNAATPEPEVSISLNQTSLALTVGTPGTLTATVENATTVSWESDKPSIATVAAAADSKTATITPVAKGTATITATAGGKTATCTVTVSLAPVPAESITLDRTEVTLGIGESTVLTAAVGPENAIDKTVTWTNEKDTIATIGDTDPVNPSAKKITAVAKGTTTVTASNNTGKQIACKVTVIDKKSDTACTEHTYDQLDAVLKAPTCTKSGIGRFKCSKCTQAATIFQALPASHQYDAGVKQQAADCVDGTITYTCQREGCKAEDDGHVKTEPVKATGKHDYQQKTVTATCTKPGGTGKICSKCDSSEGPLTDVTPATGHEYDEEQTKAPTCTTTGLMTYTCPNCDKNEPGHSYTEIIPVKHNPGAPAYTPANCTDYGTIRVTCQDCGAVIADTRLESDEPKGHTRRKIPAVPATCTERGKSEGEDCSVCEFVLKAPVEVGEVDPTNHSYASTVLKPATCETPGINKQTCSRCGDSKYVSSEVAHQWEKNNSASVAPTCVKEGKDVFLCGECGTSKTEIVKALGHEWNEGEVTTPANCGKDGVKTFTCQRTGCDSGENDSAATRTEAIPKNGEHNFEEKTTKADCTHPERTGRICTVCGEADGDVITSGNPLGHQEQKTPIKAATCTTDGSERVTCGRDGCDLNEVRTIPAAHTDVRTDYLEATCSENGKEVKKCDACNTVLESHDLGSLDPATGRHDYKLHEEVPATCQKTGTTAYKQCDGCKRYENGTGPSTIPVDPNGHVYSEGDIVTIKPSDCSATPMVQAIVKKTCSLCKDASYEKIDAKHTPGEWIVITAASCEKKGERKTTCATCSKEVKEEIPATDHKYNNGAITTPATCGKDGVRTFTCTNDRCLIGADGTITKKSYTEPINATGNHNFVEQTTEADCTHPKRTGRICTTCGQADGPVTETGEALGHNYGTPTITKAADCSKKQNGEKESTCSRCNDVKKEVIDYKLTHTTVSEYKDATCTEAGKYVTKCTACNEIISTEVMDELDPPTGHTLKVTPAEAATCSKPGKTEGKTCSKCGEVVAKPTETPIDPDNHTYSGFSETKPATCTENGLKYRTCSGCGKYDYAVIPAAHSWSEDKMNEEGTAVIRECTKCTEIEILFIADGYKHCEKCGKITEPAITPGKAATCTEDGMTEGKKCGNKDCDNVFEKPTVIPKTGHTAGAWEVETPAVCNKAGSEVQKCSVCDAEMGHREIPATGKHDWEESFVDPTCTENGRTAQICKNCGQKNPDFAGEDLGYLGEVALGHDFVNGVCSRCEKIPAETTASAHVDGTKNNVRFTATVVDFPEHAPIVKKGILYITSSQYTPAGAGLEDDLKIGSSCTYVKDKYTESNTSNTIYFDLNVGTATTRKLYARGYVIVREDGAEKVYYGPAITTSFQELSK